MDATAREVQRRWAAGEAPYGDFVVFGDGSIVVMEPGFGSVRGQVDTWFAVLRATEWTCPDWLGADVALASCSHDGFRAQAGESAAHGSIGWVALTREDAANSLVWLAVSTVSNPFARVALDGTVLTAASTSGRLWTFPRDAPEEVRITADPEYPWPR